MILRWIQLMAAMHIYTIRGKDKDTGTAKVHIVECIGQKTAEAAARAKGILIDDISISSPAVKPETPEQAYLRTISYWVSFWSRLGVVILLMIVGLIVGGMLVEWVLDWTHH